VCPCPQLLHIHGHADAATLKCPGPHAAPGQPSQAAQGATPEADVHNSDSLAPCDEPYLEALDALTGGQAVHAHNLCAHKYMAFQHMHGRGCDVAEPQL